MKNEKERAYGGIVRNSLFETTGNKNQISCNNIFSATSSKVTVIPIEEEINVSSASDDIYAYLRA